MIIQVFGKLFLISLQSFTYFTGWKYLSGKLADNLKTKIIQEAFYPRYIIFLTKSRNPKLIKLTKVPDNFRKLPFWNAPTDVGVAISVFTRTRPWKAISHAYSAGSFVCYCCSKLVISHVAACVQCKKFVCVFEQSFHFRYHVVNFVKFFP